MKNSILFVLVAIFMSACASAPKPMPVQEKEVRVIYVPVQPQVVYVPIQPSVYAPSNVFTPNPLQAPRTTSRYYLH